MKISRIAQLALALTAAPSIWATALFFDFSSPPNTLGTSQTYISNGVTITAYGYNGSNIFINLYGKNLTGDESGLGLDATNASHEITTNTYVQLDLQNLWAASPTAFSMILGSAQAGEGWALFGSTTQGSLGSSLLTGSSEASQVFGVIPSAYRYISVQATAGDVLLTSLSATIPDVPPASATPEPSSLVLIGSGLIAVAFLGRRKRSS